MIAVRELTKRYARTTAVDRISFPVERGQIVGFLGPYPNDWQVSYNASNAQFLRGEVSINGTLLGS